MLKKIIHNTTFTRNVAFPGIIVLVLLSLLSALFPLKVNSWLTFVQSFIYKNLSWMYILLVSFFVIFLLAVAFSKLGNIHYGVTAEKRTLSDYLVDEDNTPDADNGTQYIPVTYSHGQRHTISQQGRDHRRRAQGVWQIHQLDQ